MTQPTTVPLFSVQVKSRDQIRDDILRTISNGLRKLGVPNPNVGPKSDYWYIALGVANEVTVGQANGVVTTNNLMPDTAGGQDLDRWLKIFGLSRAGATPSQGVVLPAYTITTGYTTIAGSPVGVPGGFQLTDASGLRYQVIQSGSYGPGNPPSQPANLYVPVVSVDVGAGTDHANGDQLTWVDLVPFVGPQATVGTLGGTDGLEGGNDSEATQDEPPRARLFDRLQNPPTGGNWPEVAQWCRDSSTEVQAGFVYPTLLGPSTVFFTACAAPQTAGVLSSTSKNRSLPAALVSGTLVPYVQGLYSTRAAVIGSSVVDQPVDVAFLLTLPSAPTAQPAGPGGGWLDGSPWPQSVGGTAPCLMTAVSSSTHFTVNATTPPVPGVTRIAYLSPTNWQLYTATVTAFSGTSGAYVVTIDNPWPNIAAEFGAFLQPSVFPQSVQQDNYVAAAFQAFANLGPGEWTASPVVLFRSFRHPSTQQTWPSALDANMLRALEDAGQEVKTSQFLFRSPTPVGGIYAPTVPTTPTITTSEPLTLTSPAPNIFVPRSISWYAQ